MRILICGSDCVELPPPSRRTRAVFVSLCSLSIHPNQPHTNRYLGLVGFVQLMRSHPKAVVEHRDLVLQCLADEDETIRLRSLELLTGMVTKRNLEELIHRLLR